jgi:hypothetical protein
MNLWESLVGIALILVVGAKLYMTWKGRVGQASKSQPANLESSESNTIEPTATDLDLAEGNTESTEAWNEGYLILIALALCGPLGLILMWRTDKWDSNTKTKLTIVYIAVVLLLAAIRLNAD